MDSLITKSELIDQFFDKRSVVAVNLIDPEPGRIKIRIRIFLTVNTGCIEGDFFGLQFFRQLHFKLIMLVYRDWVFAQNLDTLSCDIDQMPDKVSCRLIEKPQIINQMPSL
jgi:hypothetical protein